MERISPAFVRVVGFSRAGADLWPRMRRVKNTRGNIGINRHTARAWETAGLVVVVYGHKQGKMGRPSRPILSVKLTQKGATLVKQAMI
jgi:hypothetical protein